MSGKMFMIFGKLIAMLLSIEAMIDTLSQYQLIILSLPISMMRMLVYWIMVKFKAIVLWQQNHIADCMKFIVKFQNFSPHLAHSSS